MGDFGAKELRIASFTHAKCLAFAARSGHPPIQRCIICLKRDTTMLVVSSHRAYLVSSFEIHTAMYCLCAVVPYFDIRNVFDVHCRNIISCLLWCYRRLEQTIHIYCDFSIVGMMCSAPMQASIRILDTSRGQFRTCSF